MFSYIAIDWGIKHVGVAIGDPVTHLILPQPTLIQSEHMFEMLFSIIQMHKCTHLVVGLPLTFHLKPTDITNKVEQFINTFTDFLQTKKYKLTIIRCNERGTTKQAIKKIQSSNMLSRSSKDSLSAQEILTHYFLSHNTQSTL